MIIDRYLSREILRPFVLGLGLLVLVFVGFSLARQLDLAAAGQIDLVTALKLVALKTLITLEILLPSALFFSVLAALGKLYRDAEMNAFIAAGISPLRILESVFKLAVIFAIITGVISIAGRPWAYRESYRLEAQAAAEFDLRKMDTGEFVTMSNSDYVFIADGLDLQQGLHERVFLQKMHRGGERSELIYAETAALPTLNPNEPFSAQFFNGFHYLLDNRATLDVTTEFDKLTIRLPATEEQERYRRKAESIQALALSSDPSDTAEYQWRLTTPLGTILLALIAAPLSRSNPREPRTRSFFLAIGLYIGLFSLTSLVQTWIEQERIAAFPGLWGSYALFFILLVLLLYPPRLRRRPTTATKGLE